MRRLATSCSINNTFSHVLKLALSKHKAITLVIDNTFTTTEEQQQCFVN